uniref:Nucleosome assembly protein 1-like 4a n=2 Tax=Hucho hucho TaxID=62062 RepID=A0A4W5MRJ1_9TELE
MEEANILFELDDMSSGDESDKNWITVANAEGNKKAEGAVTMEANKAEGRGKGDHGMQIPGGPLDRQDSLHNMESLLPKAVKRRVYALKKLQVQCAYIEAKFYEEVHELERKYAGLYQPLFDKRRDVVTATVEPTDEDCEWHNDREEEEELAEELKKKAAVEEKKEDAAPEEDPKGIPEFWLTIFKSVDMLSDMLQEHDEPILKHLQDIQVKFSEPGQPMSFTLEFHFEPNGFFNNAVLSKVYKMKSEPEDDEPFSFEGPEIFDCEGCQIDWHKGKDVTVKTIKKKQKHKGRGTVRTVTKQVPNDSFFNFFNPIKGISNQSFSPHAFLERRAPACRVQTAVTVVTRGAWPWSCCPSNQSSSNQQVFPPLLAPPLMNSHTNAIEHNQTSVFNTCMPIFLLSCPPPSLF